MSQNDFSIANQSGLLFRQDLNNALQALASNSSGSTEPTTTYAFQYWVDTSGSNPILKVRNSANTAWIIIGRTDLEAFGLNAPVASDTAPSSPIAFQYWIDTTGATAVLKVRNEANDAWITLGRLDLTNYGLLPLTGGTLSGPILFSNTDHIRIPSGTTLQRPGSPSAGMIRYNSDLVSFEGHNGSAWAPIGGGGFVVSTSQSVTTGGTITTSTTDTRQMRPVQGNAASVEASVTPFGSAGGWKDGTEVLLIGVSDTNSVILTFNDAAKGLVGNFETIELTLYRSITCVYSSALDRWIVKGGF